MLPSEVEIFHNKEFLQLIIIPWEMRTIVINKIFNNKNPFNKIFSQINPNNSLLIETKIIVTSVTLRK